MIFWPVLPVSLSGSEKHPNCVLTLFVGNVIVMVIDDKSTEWTIKIWSDKNMYYLQGNYCHRNNTFLLLAALETSS